MTAIEGKGKEVVGERDLRGLRALREEGLLRNYLVVSCERRPRVTDGITILPWEDFLDCMWAGKFTD